MRKARVQGSGGASRQQIFVKCENICMKFNKFNYKVIYKGIIWKCTARRKKSSHNVKKIQKNQRMVLPGILEVLEFKILEVLEFNCLIHMKIRAGICTIFTSNSTILLCLNSSLRQEEASTNNRKHSFIENILGKTYHISLKIKIL